MILLILALAGVALAQNAFHRKAEFEQQPALTIANDKLELTLSAQGGALINLVLLDDA